MKNKNYFLAAILGGVSFFLLGWLIYGIVLMDFMNTHSGLPADVLAKVNKPMDQMVWWAVIVANLASGFMLATIFDWANINTATGGAKAGAIVAFFMCLSYDLMFYSFTNMQTPTTIVVDIIAGVVMTAIGSAVIGWMMGRGMAKT